MVGLANHVHGCTKGQQSLGPVNFSENMVSENVVSINSVSENTVSENPEILTE